MGSGPLRKKAAQNAREDTSGYADSKSSGPDSRRVVAAGLPLRLPSSTEATNPAAAKQMAGEEDVFQDTSNIFVVFGASVSCFHTSAEGIIQSSGGAT